MPFAARLADRSDHGGAIVPGPLRPAVIIAGRPAAVLGDLHACPVPQPPPHPATSPVLQGSATVTLGGAPAARAGDHTGCGASLLADQATVSIGG